MDDLYKFLQCCFIFLINILKSYVVLLYGDPPILTSPHPRIYAHSYTAHFSTFSAQSVAHLCCAHVGAVIT